MSKRLVLTTEKHHTCKQCGYVDTERMSEVNEGYRQDADATQRASKIAAGVQGKYAMAKIENQRLRREIASLHKAHEDSLQENQEAQEYLNTCLDLITGLMPNVDLADKLVQLLHVCTYVPSTESTAERLNSLGIKAEH